MPALPKGEPRSRCEFLLFRTIQLVSPSGRDVAQRQRGLLPADIASQICPNTNLLACCPLSHLLANASSPEGRAKKLVRTAILINQAISCADLPACCSFRAKKDPWDKPTGLASSRYKVKTYFSSTEAPASSSCFLILSLIHI